MSKQKIIRNPILDNRIVSDYTFALRFFHFVERFEEECMCDCALFEEWEYMRDCAKDLLKYQAITATDKDEIGYLKRLKVIKDETI